MRSTAEILSLVAAGAVPNLAYLAAGLWIARGLGITARGAERLALAFALGTGAASLAVLGLRALDVPVPMSALGVVALLGAPALLDLRGPPGPARPAWASGIDAVSAFAAVALFLAALAPETTWDGFEYHLPMVQAWVDGPIRAIPGMLDAELRAGVDLLYVPAVAFDQPDAAAAVSACFALALALMIRAEAGRRASPGAGSIAAFFALVVPFTLEAAPTTYVDIAVGCYGFAALLFADRYSRTGEVRLLWQSAFFLGFAANAKLHAAILAPAALAVVLLGGRVPRPRDLAVAATLAAALVAPWFAKSALTTGNPLFPLFCEWLGYGATNAEQLAWKRNDVYYYVRVDRDPAGFLRYLASLTFGRGYHVGGLLGPLPLALAPLALQRLPRPTWALSAALAALFGLQFVFMPALRFGAPLLPFLAVAAAVGGARLVRSGRSGAVVTGAALALAAAVALPAAVDALGPRITALDTPRAYERQAMPAQANLRDVVARGEALVAIPRGAVSWMPKPVYNLHWSRNGELFFDGRTPPGAALALLAKRGVRSLVIDAPRGIGPRGPVGHPIVDAWLLSGRATLRPDAEPPAARRNRVWRLVDLRWPLPTRREGERS